MTFDIIYWYRMSHMVNVGWWLIIFVIVIENTSYCQLHILYSRFAAALGYRRCAHRLKNKRCHRPVKVSSADLASHLKESDLAGANESVVCGRHNRQTRAHQTPIEQSLTRGRLDECFFDIPDSEGDSDSADHPLEGSNLLSQRELAQVLQAKVERLKRLYKSELDRTNLDLIRAERNDTKNISYHFLKQSLTGNEVIVRQPGFPLCLNKNRHRCQNGQKSFKK